MEGKEGRVPVKVLFVFLVPRSDERKGGRKNGGGEEGWKDGRKGRKKGELGCVGVIDFDINPWVLNRMSERN